MILSHSAFVFGSKVKINMVKLSFSNWNFLSSSYERLPQLGVTCICYMMYGIGYWITNTKHLITYLALTQPVSSVVDTQVRILEYTYYVVVCNISLRSLQFLF